MNHRRSASDVFLSNILKPPLGRNGFTHCPRAGWWKRFAFSLKFFDLFRYQRAKLAISLFLCGSMANAAPRKEVRTITHVEFVCLFPANKFQILILRFHLLTV